VIIIHLRKCDMVVLSQGSQEQRISSIQNQLIYFDPLNVLDNSANKLSCEENILKRLLVAKRLKTRISLSPETVICICRTRSNSQGDSNSRVQLTCKSCVSTDTFEEFVKQRENLYLQTLSISTQSLRYTEKKRSLSQPDTTNTSEAKRSWDSSKLVQNAKELFENAKRCKDKKSDLNGPVLALLETAIRAGSLFETAKVLECLCIGEDNEKHWDENLACLLCMKCLKDECSSRFCTLILRELLYPQIKNLSTPARRDLFQVAIQSAKKFPTAFTEGVLLNLLTVDQDIFNSHKLEILDRIVKECMNKKAVAEMVTEWIERKPNTLWSESHLGALQTTLSLQLKFPVNSFFF